jgi:hypothetical protein
MVKDPAEVTTAGMIKCKIKKYPAGNLDYNISNKRNCVFCSFAKLLSETNSNVLWPLGRSGPKVTPSILSI